MTLAAEIAFGRQERGLQREALASLGNRSPAVVVCLDRSAHKTDHACVRFGATVDRGIPGSRDKAGRGLHQIPRPIFASRLQVTRPPPVATPDTSRPRCRSNAGRQGTSWKPDPSSIIANRPDPASGVDDRYRHILPLRTGAMKQPGLGGEPRGCGIKVTCLKVLSRSRER